MQPPDDNLIPADKLAIIKLFLANVKGRKADSSVSNAKHAGKDGHWLEKAMGLAINKNNAPDMLGYEMKNGTALKTTFGDWSADYYIFKGKNNDMTRSDFLRIFGKPNALKNDRHSWSGEPCPKIGGYNNFGQIMVVDENNNILVMYSYSKDMRADKMNIVPSEYQIENLVIARWSVESMKRRVENKFNDKGWFKCEKDTEGYYVSIAFGDPITFDSWIKCVRQGDVFFDSGMYDGNPRPYSQWRASNNFWDNLVTPRYV